MSPVLMQAMLYTYIVCALVNVCKYVDIRGSSKNVHTQRQNDAKLVGIFVSRRKLLFCSRLCGSKYKPQTKYGVIGNKKDGNKVYKVPPKGCFVFFFLLYYFFLSRSHLFLLSFPFINSVTWFYKKYKMRLY